MALQTIVVFVPGNKGAYTPPPIFSVKFFVVITGVTPVPLPPLTEAAAVITGAVSGFNFITVISEAIKSEPFTCVVTAKLFPPWLDPALNIAISINLGSFKLSVHISKPLNTLIPVIRYEVLKFNTGVAAVMSTTIGATKPVA